jgi:hypothetical protein
MPWEANYGSTAAGGDGGSIKNRKQHELPSPGTKWIPGLPQAPTPQAPSSKPLAPSPRECGKNGKWRDFFGFGFGLVLGSGSGSGRAAKKHM